MSTTRTKMALVTGASRGIGAAIAVELARHGADVVVNYSRSEAGARDVQTRIEGLGRRAICVRADIAQKHDVDCMFDEIETAWGPIDILVNNAGIVKCWPSRDCKESDYDVIMDTNLKGAFFCAQRALEGMKANGWGRVINISSVHEIAPTASCSVYGMSKGGMMMMMRELAIEYSRHGITVNNVAPGVVRTDINRQVLSDPVHEAEVIAKIPAGFMGMPEDVAKVVAFLVSEDARYITGASILVDGGLSL